MHTHVVRIRTNALRAITLEARTSMDGRETGGILLGHDPAPDGGVEVTTAGDPGPAADRRPNGFTRDLAHARHLADQAFDLDGSVWLGEWHTHPTGPPAPSSQDMNTYRKLLADDRLDFERIVSLIVTPHPAHGWQQPLLWSWLITSATIDAAQPIIATCDLPGSQDE